MKSKITVIGSGAMGTAISKVLYDSGNKNIVIYGINKDELNELKQGKNTKFFPADSKIPKFNVNEDLKDSLKDAKYIIMAIPSNVFDIVFQKVLFNISSDVIIINLSKGFYPNSNDSLYEGMSQISKGNDKIKGLVSLIGPSHAEEIIKEHPTVISLVGKNKKIMKEIQGFINNKYFKTDIETDVKGAQIGAAYKNVLAIASGMCSGIGYGINTISVLLTRGLDEMIRFNKVMHGKKKTIIGLTGLGDLIATATSDLSRNFSFGKEFALNEKKVIDSDNTTEGLVALNYIYKIGKDKQLNLPIVNLLYEIIYNNVEIKKIINIL